MSKKQVEQLLEDLKIKNKQEIVNKLEGFISILFEENQKINLVSRKMPKKEYWSKHILDSLLILNHFSFHDENILDFGTGGGLPGIPVKILFPKIRLYLLDSKRKKIKTIRKMLKKLDLNNCIPISTRLEELDDSYNKLFNFVLCRSVKINKKYAKKMKKIIRKNGSLILYKSRKTDDLNHFNKFEIFEENIINLGKRKIINIKYD